MAALRDFTPAPVWKLSVDQYHAMIGHGILGPDDRLELLEGVLVEKMSKNPPHCIANFRVRRALEAIVPAGWHVAEQRPITLAKSEPEPGVVIIRGEMDDYHHGHPRPSDVALVIEISDSSLDRDRIFKKGIYAAAGIPYYWVLDLTHRRLEVYLQPRDGEYTRVDVYGPDDAAPVALDGREIGSMPVSNLIPRLEAGQPA